MLDWWIGTVSPELSGTTHCWVGMDHLGFHRVGHCSMGLLYRELAQHPILTRERASLWISLLLYQEGRKSAALREMMAIANSNATIHRTIMADQRAADQLHGHYVAVMRRPIAAVGLHLIRGFGSSDANDESYRVGEAVIQKVSPDGWYWELNKELGDFYSKREASGDSQAARQQYDKALQGYLRHIRIEARFKKMLGGTWDSNPVGSWERQILVLKEAIRDTGGGIDLNADELKSIKALYRGLGGHNTQL
jgi:hypothetical protein